MKTKFAIAAVSALMLIAAPTALADGSESSDPGSGNADPVSNTYPPLPPECQPTADRTAIECTYDYGDRIDVQPAYGCWTLADDSTLCVDGPEIPDFVGCDYAAGECEIVVDPATDRCVVAFGPEIDRTIYLIRDANLYVIEWNWGADPSADEALRQGWSELFQLIASGDYTEYFARCAPNLDQPVEDTPVDEPTDSEPTPLPYPSPDGTFDGGEVVLDSPVASSGARGQRVEKAQNSKKAKKKSRGKKSKQKKQRR
jgi:hypothetical protein